MKGAASRISEKYRRHMAEIARLYVDLAGNKEGCAREARKIPECAGFKADFFKRWLQNPEFAALLAEAQDGQANRKRLRPSIRGPQRIAWLIEVEKQLKSRHEDAEDDKAKDTALRALLQVGQDIRDEERHYEEMQQKVARRDMAKFIRNMISFVRVRHSAAHATVFPILRDMLKNLDQIQAGSFEEA